MLDNIPDNIEEEFDAIDAALFTGDSFVNEKALDALDAYLTRWTKQSVALREVVKDAKEEENEFG